MPSTIRLASARVKSRNRLAKFLLSFCGIASFGVFAILTSINTNALSTVSNQVSVNIPGSIAMRLLDSTATQEISSLSFDLTPTPSGTQATKRTIVDIATSNPTGYKLYMQSNYQKDGNYTTDLIHQDAQVSDSIPTSTSASTLYWNYNNPLTATTNTIPAHGHPDKIAQHFETTNSDQVPVDINVSVDNTIVSGTYENQLLFSAVGNPTNISYKLDFNTGSGTMTGADIEESAAAWAHSITIPGNPNTNNYTDYIPTGVNALFTGWVISIPTGSSTTASCNSTNICHPGDTINITGSVDQSGDMVGEVTLTAQYVSISTMQAMTPTICNTATIGAATTLTDTRDNKTYTIRKLKDNNCWMTQNLRLTGSSSLIALTSSDSNVALDFTIPIATDAYLNSDQGDNEPYNAWCNTNAAWCRNRPVNRPSDDYTYGTYYTWNVATAGTGTYELSSGNATSSICPKGWRLPTGGDGGEFEALAEYYPVVDGVNQMIDGEPQFVLSGRQYYDGFKFQGSLGLYWSSTSANPGNARYIEVHRVSSTQYNNAKDIGYALRCLAHDNSYSVLGVDPNGGTWSGSTKGQTFAGTAGETKTISNPTTGPTYNISFDMSTSSMPAPANTTVDRPFSGWTFNGAGSFTGTTYEYGAGNAQLKAQYSTTSNTFTLPSINNGFAGTCKWAEGSTSGTQYAPGTQRTVSGNTTYYAMCYMQEMTTDICANAPLNSTAVLTDIRDNNTYSVKKLKDGKCWMTQNLRLTGPQNLTPANSNVRTNWSLPTQTSESDDGSTAGANKWCTGQNQECVDRAVNLNTNNYDYGTYYTWNAATAGTGTYDMTSGNTDSSICPKGWRLPTGASGGEFQALYNQYPSADSMLSSDGPAIVLSGDRYGGVTSRQNTDGIYRSSTIYNNNFTYTLSMNNSVVYPVYYRYGYKNQGLPIRCVAATQEHVLTVNPNGGTWNGSTSTQYFEQTSGTTKNISNPTGPAYTISYDMGSTGMPAPSSPTSANRPFTSWATSGSGTLVNGIYTFGDGNGTLLAQYSNQSETFTLPTINNGFGGTCKWAEGSTSGTQYAPGTQRTVSGNTTYYAMCYMQEMTTSICSNAALNDTATLTDIRDNNTYSVKKLMDGKCWMTQNLRLTGPITLHSTDSNVTRDWELPEQTGDVNTGFLSNVNAWAPIGGGAPAYQTRTVNLYSGNTNDGTYYSFNAVATGTSGVNSQAGNITQTICPKGWRLPTGDTGGEFSSLYSYYNSYAQMTSSVGPNLKLSGFRNGSSTVEQSTKGKYWSSTAVSGFRAYAFVVDGGTSTVTENESMYKIAGYTVRCIAQ